MNKFTRLIEMSSSVKQYAKATGMDQDAVYEFFYECYAGYRDMFMTRLKIGSQFKRIMGHYNHIPEFSVLRPSEITTVIFNSREMAYWFAFQWWIAIDRQVKHANIDKTELQLELTTMGLIPMASIMENILYEQIIKKSTADLLFSERQVAEISSTEVGTRITVNG